MNEHNRDLSPSDAIKSMFGEIGPLIANQQVNQAFMEFEQRAVRSKARYHRLGRLGMALVMASTLYTVAEGLVLPPFAAERTVSVTAIAAGILGLCLQIGLLASGLKQSWLLARFGAERVRSIAFQAFPLAEAARDPGALAVAANTFYAQALAKLHAELNTGPAALDIYRAEAALGLPDPQPSPAEPRMAVAAAQAYIELRLEYQQRFASSECLKLREDQRVGETLADFLYLAGGGLAVTALTVKLVLPSYIALSAWIDFIAVSAFIVGLSKVVFDAASNSAPSRERYELYHAKLRRISEEQADGHLSLASLVRQTEATALEELGQFCQSASQISYRL